jgi:heme exporter protein B
MTSPPAVPVLPPPPAPWRFFAAQCRRDLRIALRQPGDLLNPLAFFVMVVALFPLGIDPDPQVLARLSPGILWIVALLSMLLSLDGLFRRDFDDGSLELLVLGADPLFVGVLAKFVAFWLLSGLPLALLAPLLSFVVSLPPAALPVLLVSLLLGTLLLSLLGAFGAALTVGVRRAGVLVPLLILPLCVPLLLLAVSAVQFAAAGDSARGPLLWLGALLSAALAGLPFAIAQALRIGVER